MKIVKPENYVEPPDGTKLLPFLAAPPSPFWKEFGHLVSWLKYLREGPKPRIEITLQNLYQDIHFSPQTIYKSIDDEVTRQRLPNVELQRINLHESGPFSPYRTYLQINREFWEYVVCAAPMGTSFFVTVRTVDKFPHVRWFNYLLGLLVLSIFFYGGMRLDGVVGGVVVMAVAASFLWSLFRLGSRAQSWLSEQLIQSPLVGRFFIRWFRPDTFYRQDVHSAFVALVDGAIKKVVAGLEPAPPRRPEESIIPLTKHDGLR